MSDEATKVEISKDDIERVSDRLEGLMDELSEQERNVLGLILTRAAAADDEAVKNTELAARPHESFTRPFAGQLAKAAGLTKPQVTVVVGWTYRFKTPFEGRELEAELPELRREAKDLGANIRKEGPQG
jgi:DNA gyrase/topoisomerase IV subunit A